MNMAKSVNISRRAASMAVEERLAAKLRELLESIGWLGDWSLQRFPTVSDRGFDFLVKLPRPKGGKVELWVQCKSDPRPSQFPYAYVASEAKRPPVRVFAAPFVSPRLATACAEHGWSWFDLAGNCRIDVPGLLHLERCGQPPVHGRPRPTANLGTAAAGRVIRALLAPEHAGMRWTHQALSRECQPGVSLGLVNKVARHLRDERYVEYLPLPEEGLRLRDPLGLLAAWREAYRFDRHERRGYFTLLQGKGLQDALAGLDARTGGFAAYAAFSAADFQAPHVRQPKTWLFVGARHLPLFEKLAEAKVVDSGENLVVLIADDDGVFFLGEGGRMGERRLRCTNAVQTYVDLCHCGGRGEEAAEALLNQRLKPEWKRRGLNV
jgi:hypothetical protein